MSPRKFARGRRPRRRAAIPYLEGLEARSLLSTAQVLAPAGGPSYVPGEFLVQFKPGVGEAARAAVRGQVAATLAESIQTVAMRDAGAGVLERLTLPADRPVDAAIRALENNPNVAYAEPNWIYTHQVVSNDPYYTNGRLWGMYGAHTTPSNPYGSRAGEAWAQYTDPAQVGSKGVYVGIIDEGIQYTHLDLDANAWTNPNDPVDGIDNDGDGYIDDIHGWDFVNNDNTIYDGGTTGRVDKHGTHVTGTIGAEGGNGTGVVGVNWNVTYISAKFLGQNGGTTANAIKAVDYITTLKTRDGLNVVATNNSWGGGG
ncbi:MAG: S8 family serine peptidase, partial [Isosphaeraceae bacterium]|nr:S8 family serine peptidase [Isosphaeraceae bacterium]